MKLKAIKGQGPDVFRENPVQTVPFPKQFPKDGILNNHSRKSKPGKSGVDGNGDRPKTRSKLSPQGAPMKYREFIQALGDHEVYSPATVLSHGLEAGIELPGTGDDKRKKMRVRIALGQFSRNRGFPIFGDGLVVIRGQGSRAGWYGWRWKQALS